MTSHKSKTSKVSCGRDLPTCGNIHDTLRELTQIGFDFACVPIFHPRFKRDNTLEIIRDGPLTRTDLCLSSQDWSRVIVGKLSPWIDTDSPIDHIRESSICALQEEISYAHHLSLPAILIHLTSHKCENLARKLSSILASSYPSSLSCYWIHVKMTSGGPKQLTDSWLWFHKFRTMAAPAKRIYVALELSADLCDFNEDRLRRWLGEPLKAIVISTDLFLTNSKGYPVLPRAHQSFIQECFRLKCQLILTGNSRLKERSIQSYWMYLNHLWETMPPLDAVSVYAKGWEDHLQNPLQPLMDNLESATYETFERDPVKYTEYQRAIYSALSDLVEPELRQDVSTVIMVVGAGRGPLVTASLSAAKQAGCKVKLYAVEKNPNAVVTLRAKCEQLWLGDDVTVVSSDMRQWQPPELADILVSELLGSFGDNELSPECLDGAQKLLKKTGISIPSDYTSYLAPVQSMQLHNNASDSFERYKPPEFPFEMPYVVRMHNYALIASPKAVFHFEHPNWEKHDNNRYKILEFQAKIDTVVHGFAGYFKTVLYKDILLSIVPDGSMSEGMFSWFSIYFPIKEPMFIHAGETIELHIWRINDARNVWYEWCITAPRPCPVHNLKGRSYLIGL